MPRVARIVAPGHPHHITQRGNYAQEVFPEDSDRQQYLEWIAEYSKKHEVSLLGYCLMGNHVHFIAVPRKDDSLAKTFNAAHMRYSQYINKKRNVRGHLWQGRFFSCVLEGAHIQHAARYIERNPVRAQIVQRAWDWPWSSARQHSGEGRSGLVLGDVFGYMEIPASQWKGYLSGEEDARAIEVIRRHTYTGRPLGKIEFIEQLQKRFQRRLAALPRGRPRVIQK